MDLQIRQLERSLSANPSDLLLRVELLRAYLKNGIITSKTLIEAAALDDLGAIEIVGNRNYDSLSRNFYLLRAITAVKFANFCFKQDREKLSLTRLTELQETFAAGLVNNQESIALGEAFAKDPSRELGSIISSIVSHRKEQLRRYWNRSYIARTDIEEERGNVENIHTLFGYIFGAIITMLTICTRNSQAGPKERSDDIVNTVGYALSAYPIHNSSLFTFLTAPKSVLERRKRFDQFLKPMILERILPGSYPHESVALIKPPLNWPIIDLD